jgi:hypothetical protein
MCDVWVACLQHPYITLEFFAPNLNLTGTDAATSDFATLKWPLSMV